MSMDTGVSATTASDLTLRFAFNDGLPAVTLILDYRYCVGRAYPRYHVAVADPVSIFSTSSQQA
jgi:hypothetical protein